MLGPKRKDISHHVTKIIVGYAFFNKKDIKRRLNLSLTLNATFLKILVGLINKLV